MHYTLLNAIVKNIFFLIHCFNMISLHLWISTLYNYSTKTAFAHRASSLSLFPALFLIYVLRVHKKRACLDHCTCYNAWKSFSLADSAVFYIISNIWRHALVHFLLFCYSYIYWIHPCIPFQIVTKIYIVMCTDTKYVFICHSKQFSLKVCFIWNSQGIMHSISSVKEKQAKLYMQA